MVDISFIEWIVYGIFAYGTGIVLLASIIKDDETVSPTKALSVIRSVWAVPGVIAAGFLSQTGVDITFPTNTILVNEYTINGSTGAFITNSTTLTTQLSTNILINPVWMYFHFMLFVVYLVFVLTQMFALLVKKY